METSPLSTYGCKHKPVKGNSTLLSSLLLELSWKTNLGERTSEYNKVKTIFHKHKNNLPFQINNEIWRCLADGQGFTCTLAFLALGTEPRITFVESFTTNQGFEFKCYKVKCQHANGYFLPF